MQDALLPMQDAGEAFPSPANVLEQLQRTRAVHLVELQYHVEGCRHSDKFWRARGSGSGPVASRCLPSWDSSMIASQEAPPACIWATLCGMVD